MSLIFVLNLHGTFVLTKMWIISNSLFSHRVCFRAKVSISFFKLLPCYEFFLVTLFLPLLLKYSVDTILISLLINLFNYLFIVVGIKMIQGKQDHQKVKEMAANLTMKRRHPHRMHKQNHPPLLPPTVTVNSEGGGGVEDRLRS